jgi:hypothetical protein
VREEGQMKKKGGVKGLTEESKVWVRNEEKERKMDTTWRKAIEWRKAIWREKQIDTLNESHVGRWNWRCTEKFKAKDQVGTRRTKNVVYYELI